MQMTEEQKTTIWRRTAIVLFVGVLALSIANYRALLSAQTAVTAEQRQRVNLAGQLSDEQSNFARCREANAQLAKALLQLDGQIKGERESCKRTRETLWVSAND